MSEEKSIRVEETPVTVFLVSGVTVAAQTNSETVYSERYSNLANSTYLHSE